MQTSPVPELASRELTRLVARLRTIGPARLTLPAAPPFATRADAVHHLVRELVHVAGDDHGFPAPLADVVLGDQVAVVGADALAALHSHPGADAVFLLGEIVLHRYDLDATLPKGEVARLLGDGDLVATLRGRCPA